MKNKWIKETVEWIVCFIVAYAIYLCINYFLGTIATVRQASMYPTCEEKDKILISRRVLFSRALSRGDIVIVEAPLDTEDNTSKIAQYEERNGLSYFTYKVMGLGKKSYIKRIIALPGERIYISEEGAVYINDELLEEKYLVEGLKTPRLGDVYDLVVPEGYVFVMGDNREGSKDSRFFGAVPIEKVEGKVVIRIWPLNKMGKI